MSERRDLRSDGGTEMEPLDFDSIDDSRDFFAGEAFRLSGGWVILFCTPEGVAPWRDAIEAAGAKYKRACPWVKPDSAPQLNGQGPASACEMIVTAWAGRGHSRWNSGGKRGVYTHMVNTARYGGGVLGVNGGKGHPTEKPLSLMAELVSDFTLPGDVVLDPCMGSGTTGVACLRAGRRFIGIEQKRKYFDLACERLQAAHDQFDFVTQGLLAMPKAKQDFLMELPKGKKAMRS